MKVLLISVIIFLIVAQCNSVTASLIFHGEFYAFELFDTSRYM